MMESKKDIRTPEQFRSALNQATNAEEMARLAVQAFPHFLEAGQTYEYYRILDEFVQQPRTEEASDETKIEPYDALLRFLNANLPGIQFFSPESILRRAEALFIFWKRAVEKGLHAEQALEKIEELGRLLSNVSFRKLDIDPDVIESVEKLRGQVGEYVIALLTK